MTWLTTADAAEYVKRDPNEVRRMAKSGQIPAHRIEPVQRPGRTTKGHGTWRYDTAELDAWMRGDEPVKRPITTRPRRTRRAS